MNIGYLMQKGVDIRTPPYNGPANHVREVIQAWEKRGHKVRTLLQIDETLWRTDDLETFTRVDVPRLDQGLPRLFERGARRLQAELRLPYAAFFESRRFGAAIEQELGTADLLYERLSWVGYGGGLAANRLKIPLVLEDNGDQLADLEAKGIAPTGLQKKLSVALMAQAVRRASHVISTGEGWRRKFINRWGCPHDKVTTVENGTSLVELLQRDQLRSFLPEEADARPAHLVYVGGFYPWHGVPILIQALADGLNKGLRMHLTLIGAGEGEAEARDLISRLGLAENVTMSGHLPPEAFAPLLADADIGLSPYCGWHEFSGLKIFDYKAAGLATITSGLNGEPKTIKDGGTGLIVPPCDQTALARAIQRLVDSPDLRREMGQAARLEAENCHSWSHTAAQIEEILVRLHQRSAG